MNKILTTKFGITDRKAAFVLTMLVLALILMTLTQDFLRSELKNSAFYFSESFMFSSFWWLFAPLLFTQHFVVKHKSKMRLEFQVAVIILPIFLHLFVYPFLVWVLSKVFYYHTYPFQQTFRYTLSEHLNQLVLFYSIPVFAFQHYYRKTKLAKTVSDTQNLGATNQFVGTIIVSDGNKKHKIVVSEILYFSASPPYINIHCEGKKYIHNETLKSIAIKLDPEYFLRVSRNFATDFKNLFGKTHHLTTK